MVNESLRILILEDNLADAELVQFELAEAKIKFTAKRVMTEKDFVRELQQFSPDLILSDYDLPKYNGALALDEVKRRCPDIPFVLVTGAIVEDRAIEILTQGAKDYVLKTRLQQRLVPAVKRALSEAEEHRARKQAEEELREAHRSLEERIKIRTVELECLSQELHTHQIELEMQNEQLREVQIEATKEHQKYVDLYDFAPVGYFTLDKKGHILEANVTGASLLGMEKRSLINQPFLRFILPEYLTIFRSHLQKAVEHQKKNNCKLILNKKDGSPFNALIETIAVINSDGKFGQYRSSLTDITEMTKAEAEAARLATFPQLNPNPIVEVDFAGQIHYLNPAAERIFPDLRQRKTEHPLLKDWQILVLSLSNSESKEITREVNVEGRWYLQSLHLIEKTRRIHIYGMDIAACKRAEEELVASEIKYSHLHQSMKDESPRNQDK